MTSSALRVLVAPDCFGDSLTAVEAATAIARGWGAARPSDQLVSAPQSDGGPGFVDVLASRLGGLRSAQVSGPLSDDVTAQWVFDEASGTAYVECAQACGLALLGGPPNVDTALAAHSRGVGQLVDLAITAGATRIVVGLGGSGCTDGGKGLVDALGGLSTARDRLADIDLIAATDVEHPLLGPMGAAAVFGPQKGADPDTVAVLERRLADWATELNAVAGRDVAVEAGAGAAGGLGAALLALGARRASGAAVIADFTGLADDVAAADLIITGEGRFDDQSLHGKVVSALTGMADPAHTEVLVLAGQVTLSAEELAAAGVGAARSITDYAGSVQRAIDDAANQLEGLARATAAERDATGGE
jgi:glycerate kinase